VLPPQITSQPTQPIQLATNENSFLDELLDTSSSIAKLPTEKATITLMPTILPSPTNTPSPSNTSTPIPTVTKTPTSTSTPSATPIPLPKINILFQACNSGLDILNGFGEVTNAYMTIQNIGENEAKNVAIALVANDEDRLHPDNKYLVKYLPVGYEISLKLSVDTKNKIDTKLTVIVNTEEGIQEKAEKDNCNSYLTDNERIDSLGILFKVVKIGTGN